MPDCTGPQTLKGAKKRIWRNQRRAPAMSPVLAQAWITSVLPANDPKLCPSMSFLHFLLQRRLLLTSVDSFIQFPCSILFQPLQALLVDLPESTKTYQIYQGAELKGMVSTGSLDFKISPRRRSARIRSPLRTAAVTAWDMLFACESLHC